MADIAGTQYVIHGQKELVWAFTKAGKDERKYVREVLGKIAEPVARDSTRLAVENISHLKPAAKWSYMRVGVTQQLVYVVPAQRGTKVVSRKRPNFRNLMQPLMDLALIENEDKIVEGVNVALERIELEWGTSG